MSRPAWAQPNPAASSMKRGVVAPRARAAARPGALPLALARLPSPPPLAGGKPAPSPNLPFFFLGDLCPHCCRTPGEGAREEQRPFPGTAHTGLREGQTDFKAQEQLSRIEDVLSAWPKTTIEKAFSLASPSLFLH